MLKKSNILILALAFMGLSANVANAQSSGKCGPNLQWSFNSSTGQLTITGTGNMYDYDGKYYGGGSMPYLPDWYFFRNNITSISLEVNITPINNYTFSGDYNALTSLTIGSSFTIGLDYIPIVNLTTIIVAEDNPSYSIVDGILYDKQQTSLIRCPNRKRNSVYYSGIGYFNW